MPIRSAWQFFCVLFDKQKQVLRIWNFIIHHIGVTGPSWWGHTSREIFKRLFAINLFATGKHLLVANCDKQLFHTFSGKRNVCLFLRVLDAARENRVDCCFCCRSKYLIFLIAEVVCFSELGHALDDANAFAVKLSFCFKRFSSKNSTSFSTYLLSTDNLWARMLVAIFSCFQ